MTLPYTQLETIWSAQAATATASISDHLSRRCPTKVFEIITTGFSGTLDIQGRISPNTTLDNVNYYRLGQGVDTQPTNAQLSYTTDTGRYRYMVVEPHMDMSLVMTRSAGSITAHVGGWGLLMPTTGPKRGEYKALFSLLPATVITDNTAVTGTAVTGLGGMKSLVVVLTVAAKTFDASTTMNVYIQTSPDDGTTWDDIISFSQITNAAIGNGTYIAKVVNVPTAGFVDRVASTGALTANSKVDYICDRVRAHCAGANISGTDTITLTIQAVAYA